MTGTKPKPPSVGGGRPLKSFAEKENRGRRAKKEKGIMNENRKKEREGGLGKKPWWFLPAA